MDAIVLKNDKELIGVGNIVISEFDNKIYINNASQILENVEGSLLCYREDNSSSLEGTGYKCVWNKEKSTLEILNCEISNLKVSDYAKLNKINVVDWVGFGSIRDENLHDFEFSLRNDQKSNKEILVFSVKNDQEKTPRWLVVLENQRVSLKSIVNIESSHPVITPIGEPKDKRGDINFDKNFLYYCHRDYDGFNKIWKRCFLVEW